MNYAHLRRIMSLTSSKKPRRDKWGRRIRETPPEPESIEEEVSDLPEPETNEEPPVAPEPEPTPEPEPEPSTEEPVDTPEEVEEEEPAAPAEPPIDESDSSEESDGDLDYSTMKKHELWALVKDRDLQGSLQYASVSIGELIQILEDSDQ